MLIHGGSDLMIMLHDRKYSKTSKWSEGEEVGNLKNSMKFSAYKYIAHNRYSSSNKIPVSRISSGEMSSIELEC